MLNTHRIRAAARALAQRNAIMLAAAGLAFCGALVGLNGAAIASTPDGDTPANEGVCDVLKGGTPGLYGLCVAYCEAQDLDTVGDKEPPNNKILRNYRRKMVAGDPDMPCIKVPCPCWSDAEFASLATNFDAAASVCQVGATAQVRNFLPSLQFAIADPARPSCRFTDTTVSPPISRPFADDPADPQFDPASWQTCYDNIAALCP